MPPEDPGNKTFIRITNRKIYNEIIDLKKLVMETNGKVKFNRKWLTLITGIGGAFMLFILGWLLKLASKSSM